MEVKVTSTSVIHFGLKTHLFTDPSNFCRCKQSANRSLSMKCMICVEIVVVCNEILHMQSCPK